MAEKVSAMIVARMKSERFPGKALASLCGKPIIAWVIQQAREIEDIDEVYVLTSGLDEDEILAETALKYGATNVWRGPEKNLFKRQVEAFKATETDIYVEMSGDTPIIQKPVSERMIAAAIKYPGYDHYSALHTHAQTFGEGVVSVRRYSWFEKVAAWYADHPDEFEARKEQYWNAENDFPNCFDFNVHITDISDIQIREKTPIKTSIDYEFELHMMEFVAGKVGYFPLSIDQYKQAYRDIGPIECTNRWWE